MIFHPFKPKSLSLKIAYTVMFCLDLNLKAVFSEG